MLFLFYSYFSIGSICLNNTICTYPFFLLIEIIINISSDVNKIELLGRLEGDATTINYAVDEMKKKGIISDAADISFDHYLSEDKELIYTDDMKENITSADIVIGFSYAAGTNVLDKENPAYAAIHRAIEDVHSGDGKFILLHQFQKKTQKTPKREIEQAKRELADYYERSV